MKKTFSLAFGFLLLVRAAPAALAPLIMTSISNIANRRKGYWGK